MSSSYRLKALTLLVLAVFLLTAGLQCKLITAQQKELLKPIELSWWGVFDEPENFSEILADYKRLHPNISINYRKLRPEEFESELLDALAEDRGPDIFSIHNTWVGRYVSKIEPLPPTTRLAYQITKKSLGIKEETLIEVRETPSITAGQLKNTFIDVVSDDAVIQNKIYGLPQSVDTLALFYNRDLFNNAGLPLPPKSWGELQEYVKKLTFQDAEGKLGQAGAALGSGKNIERGFDVLSLLMLQNGAQMSGERTVLFNVVPPGGDRSYNPGPEALRFFTDFANPGKEVYSWNETFPNSLDAFVQGKVAMIFGYQYHVAYIEARRQGKLNYGVAAVPQIEGRSEVNYANYWLQTVSKKSKYVNEAWDFIQFASKAEEAKKYLAKTGKPTALRSLQTEQATDDRLSVFANQLLTAKSWYRGTNVEAAETAFSEMVDSVITDGVDPQKAADTAAQKIQQTL